MIMERVCIDRIRKDGLVFATDFSQCDHSTAEAKEIMFRLPLNKGIWHEKELKDFKLREGNCISIECKRIDKNFVHKISKIEVWSLEPDADILLDL